MKICPQCDATYHDDELNFCLIDGTHLAPGESQPTVVISNTARETVRRPGQEHETFVLPYAARGTVAVKKRRGFGFWIGMVLATIATIIGASLGGMFLYFFFTVDSDAVRQKARDDRTKTTPRSTNPVSSPEPVTTPVREPSPADGNEITEIAWNTTASAFSGGDGKVYEFECPENGKPFGIWGNAAYTADSSICTAAVHAGSITLEDGGYIVIQFRPGRESYSGATRNGITSSSFGKYDRTFVIGKPAGGK